MSGGTGDNTVTGDAAGKELNGDAGNDVVNGGTGNDSVFGGSGNDTINVGSGDDQVWGGAGNDVFIGSSGNDPFTGGKGDDTFVLSSGGGDDTVVDFGTGNDQFDSSALTDAGNVLTNQDGTVTADEVTVTGGGGSDQILTFPNGETRTVPDGTVDTSSEATQFASLVAMGVPPCFAPGTLILTSNGQRPVETLWPGDVIETADHGAQALRWVGRREIEFGDPNNDRGDKDKPIEIKAGSLASGLPARDLIVSPQHRMIMDFGTGEFWYAPSISFIFQAFA